MRGGLRGAQKIPADAAGRHTGQDDLRQHLRADDVINMVGGGPRKIRRPFHSEQPPASRGRPAVARSRILDHEPKPAVGDEIPDA